MLEINLKNYLNRTLVAELGLKCSVHYFTKRKYCYFTFLPINPLKCVRTDTYWRRFNVQRRIEAVFNGCGLSDFYEIVWYTNTMSFVLKHRW